MSKAFKLLLQRKKIDCRKFGLKNIFCLNWNFL